ncbi:MAG: PH domain-containing protein [Candidatus Altiarchaeota archaeon]
MISSDVLTKDERLELSFKPDFLATFLPVVFSAFIILAANVMLFFTSRDSPIMFKFFLIVLSISIIGLILAVAQLYLRYSYTFYLVTNRRIISQTGIVSRDHRDCRLERIQDVYVDVSFLDRILNVGNIAFSTAGGPGVEVVFMRVRTPFDVKKQINEVIDRDVAPQSKGV